MGAIAGTFLSFALGGFWYSKSAFGKVWASECGLSEEQLASASPGRMVLIAFPLILLSALVFALFLGESKLGLCIGAGFAAGLTWVGASFGVNYVFEQKSFRLWLVNAGYHTLQFTILGAAIGVDNVFF